jgi:two-component system OmpR family sensor kinase
LLSEKSIKKKFILQLIAASVALIAIFSIVLYNYIKISILDDITTSLKNEAGLIMKEDKFKSPFSKRVKTLSISNSISKVQDKIEVQIRVDKEPKISFEEFEKDGKRYLIIYYPYDKARSSFLTITKDLSGTYELFSRILKSIILVNLIGGIIILAYAFFLSETLLHPVRSINRKLARMNENFLEHIDTEALPVEFVSLAESVNKLIDRIQNFVKYQKELFIGTAHELKTPLAVMKTKNEVTLIKPRESQKYIETLKTNNKTIDEMNAMISSILEIGRQEGAQFEAPVEVNVIEFLKEKGKDFNLLAHGKDISVTMDLEPERYCILTQPTLLNHILQNFMQNAIKFSPDGSNIHIKTRLNGDDFKIEIIDEGIGIDENKDLFAPFKRFGKKSGAGLGLFLARGAADAIGAKLSIRNRNDGRSGAIAMIELNAKNFCPTDELPAKKSIFGGFSS